MPNKEPTFSIVVPLYNTERYIAEALDSIEAQTFGDFEVIVINDASTDNGPAIVQRYIARDNRFRMITQENRGLAGARNSGIRAALGRYVAFLDADDIWLPEKLQRHFDHLESNAEVGISYAPSIFIDDHGQRMRAMQSPLLDNITPEHMFCRNPVGNGSAPVLRRAMLDEVCFYVDAPEGRRSCWFDENFRQSEDIEMWTRCLVTTSWTCAGVEQPLTLYRLNTNGLSANVEKQFESWLNFRSKTADIAPELVAAVGQTSEAFQLRYLARRAAISGDGYTALKLLLRGVRRDPVILVREAHKTMATFAVAGLAFVIPEKAFERLSRWSLGLPAVSQPATA